MDINDLRALMTVIAFITFVGIVLWAWSDRRKQDFAAAAQLALDDDSTCAVPATAPNMERK